MHSTSYQESVLLPPPRHAVPLLWRSEDYICRRQISKGQRSFRGTGVGIARQLHEANPEWRKLGCPLIQSLLTESLHVVVFNKRA